MSVGKLERALLDFEREHGIGPTDVKPAPLKSGKGAERSSTEAPKDIVSVSGENLFKKFDTKTGAVNALWRSKTGVSQNTELTVAMGGSPKDAAIKLFLEHPERSRTPEGGKLLYELLNLSGILDIG